LRLIDVRHLGRERVIGCWQVDEVLIDPGPESAIEGLLEGLGDWQPRALLLTHIHLDHAGATGTLVRRWPDVEVYVHEIGAPHLADPSKLLSSAERLYGDRMQALWGEVAPVPEANLRPLAGGEDVLGFRVAYTPGHASHHVSFLHSATGRAFVGDVAGVRIPPCRLVLPPTPPPDIEVEAWVRSLDIVEEWRAESIGITHFGSIDAPAEHLQAMRAELGAAAGLARELSAPEFERMLRGRMSGCDESVEQAFIQAMPPEQHWQGLRRYWDKRAETRST
jgi:glyoxylase-like metal-dependent hydrolase (beta-lactamase superfamily II)